MSTISNPARIENKREYVTDTLKENREETIHL